MANETLVSLTDDEFELAVYSLKKTKETRENTHYEDYAFRRQQIDAIERVLAKFRAARSGPVT